MCQSCFPSSPPASRASRFESAKQLRDHHIECLYIFSKAVRRDEDYYRELGVRYHASELAARKPDTLSGNDVQRLKNVFEISSVVEYNDLFASWHYLIRDVDELRDGLCENAVMLDIMDQPCLFDRTIKTMESHVITLKGVIGLLERDVAAVSICNTHILDAGASPWTESDEYADSPLMPLKKGEEWAKVRGWAWSLPETQRAVQAGRSLDDIAIELVQVDETDGFVVGDEPWGRN